MSEFTCYLCTNTYEAQNDEEWNSFKAGETFIKLFPDGKNDFTEIVCEECHQEFMRWFYTLTEEQKARMRADHHNDRKANNDLL